MAVSFLGTARVFPDTRSIPGGRLTEIGIWETKADAHPSHEGWAFSQALYDEAFTDA